VEGQTDRSIKVGVLWSRDLKYFDLSGGQILNIKSDRKFEPV